MDRDPDPPKRSLPDSDGSPAPKVRRSEEIVSPLISPATKAQQQLTLAASLHKIKSPYKIVKTSSPGAKKPQSLLDKWIEDADKAENKIEDIEVPCAELVAVDGEKVQVAEVKNGSRDRFIGQSIGKRA